MTTSGRARKPPKEPAADPGAALASDAAATEDLPEGALQASGEPALPDDEQQLREEIERKREQLGETVEQLTAKADVKDRARAKAAELTGRAKRKIIQARTAVAAGVARVRSQVTGKTAAARQKAASVAAPGKDRLQAGAAAVSGPVRQAAPERLRRTITNGARAARQRRVPLAAAAASLLAGYLVLRWWRKR